MAMAVGRRAGPLAEINVTPMADVIVVLLIIFMIAVPILSEDRSVTLPQAVNDLSRQAGAGQVALMTASRPR